MAHGLGCVKGKPEDDFKEMIFSLDFFVTFFIKEKVRQRVRFNFTKQQNPLYSLQTTKATPQGRDKAPTMAKIPYEKSENRNQNYVDAMKVRFGNNKGQVNYKP